MQSSVRTLEKSIHQTNEWLSNLATDLQLQEKEQAFDSLRAVLHCLRDRLPADEAVNLAAQLPLVVRGVYFENWDPSRTPERIRRAGPFIEGIRAELNNDQLKERAQEIIEVTLGLINREIDPAAIEKFRQHFPEELRALWPESDAVH